MNALPFARRATIFTGLMFAAGLASAQSTLPEPVRVPAGHKVVLETVGSGMLTYECREKQDASGQFEWTFVGSDAE